MKVNVLYFGVLKDAFRLDREELDLTEASTPEALLGLLRERVEMAAGLWESLAVAVNQEYVRRNVLLHEGDEVALLPPVSGGVEEGL
jgi:molybdopterin converting factor subunit 1